MNVKAIAFASVAVPFAALPATAHHSFAMFDQEQVVTIDGTVKQFDWAQPHVWLDLMVTDEKGVSQRWGIEAESPGILTRRGWKFNSIKVGDKLTVVLHPLKDGTPGGQMMYAKLHDGKILTIRDRDDPGEQKVGTAPAHPN